VKHIHSIVLLELVIYVKHAKILSTPQIK